jgi:hypothetical protein
MAKPPAYSCYTLFNVSGTILWIQTGDQLNATTSCVLGVAAATSNLRVAIAGGQVGQAYAVVVVY